MEDPKIKRDGVWTYWETSGPGAVTAYVVDGEHQYAGVCACLDEALEDAWDFWEGCREVNDE